jgi:transcriptional regulator with XRE-family HTH domain
MIKKIKMISLSYNHDIINEIRTKLGLNQAEFARLIGVERQHVRAWENGSIPDVRSMVKVANALGRPSINFFFLNKIYQNNKNIDGNHTIHDTKNHKQDKAI